MFVFEILKAFVIGIVEGVTEWLPISSTGHMILLDELVRLEVSSEFLELFLVVIQLGAILAVPVLFMERLNPFSRKNTEAENKAIRSTLYKVAIGGIPAALLGLLLDDIINRYLYNYFTVAMTLIIYGILFIFVEKSRAEKKSRVESIENLTISDALKIGLFQALSLVPGTSRSGSTILGGMLSGVSREASAEFSFFMAIPIMLGASGLKILKFVIGGFSASGEELLLLLVGMAVSFIVSVLVIKLLMDFVKKHSFIIFGYYRIILGIFVLFLFTKI